MSSPSHSDEALGAQEMARADSSKTVVYRLDIAYDGTEFSGWQIQNNDPSIQGAIETALHTITRQTVRVVGAGRTDAGVHALGQVAHLRIASPPPPGSLKKALNGLLPPSIRILNVAEAPEGFHAQKSAIKKEYHYHICFGDVVLPFIRPYVWHYRRHALDSTPKNCRCDHALLKIGADFTGSTIGGGVRVRADTSYLKAIDLSLLEEAAQRFVGEHDFLAYANAPGHGCTKKTTVRTLYRVDVIRTDMGVRLEFEGNGFLYKMVRNITGMMVGVATGRRRLEEIDEVFLSKDRRRAEPAAPPQGLFLMRVCYPS
jgi:tRNA pseudouridine38-40 synthase